MYTAILALSLGGCTIDEGIPEVELKGKIVVPKAAATREVKANDDPADFTTTEITDVRLLGPIYIGAYSAVDTLSRPYPIPAQGPIIANEEGDAFPYGGSTVGRFDFACYQYLSCRVTTGRFSGYDDILDYFKNVLHDPVVDQDGREITSDVEFQQYCYDYYNITSDEEVAFINDLDFQEDGDNFVAEFSLFHTVYVEGMSLWGFMDAPAISIEDPKHSGVFSTCDVGGGRQQFDYDQSFYEGASYTNILNRPGQYLDVSDWVTSGVAVNSADEEITLNLDILLESVE